MKTVSILALAGAAAMVGCSSMSGLDAKSNFACKAPDGVLCESMSGIYANAMAHNLPGQRVNHGGSQTELSRAKVEAGSGVLTRPVTSGTPIRTPPLVLRVWFAPWEDSDGDLHDQSYVFVTVNNGRWLIEHNRRRIQDTYRPVRAPSPAGPAQGAQDVNSTRLRVTVPGQPQPQPASVNDDPSAGQPTPQDLLQGLVRPAIPGSPAQQGDNP